MWPNHKSVGEGRGVLVSRRGRESPSIRPSRSKRKKRKCARRETGNEQTNYVSTDFSRSVSFPTSSVVSPSSPVPIETRTPRSSVDVGDAEWFRW